MAIGCDWSKCKSTKEMTTETVDENPGRTCSEQNPCGGQSCIVLRRRFGDFVHEDYVFQQAGLPRRENCSSDYSSAQESAMIGALEGHSVVVF